MELLESENALTLWLQQNAPNSTLQPNGLYWLLSFHVLHCVAVVQNGGGRGEFMTVLQPFHLLEYSVLTIGHINTEHLEWLRTKSDQILVTDYIH